jgi:DNA-binding MarR family transcriptional regulator
MAVLCYMHANESNHGTEGSTMMPGLPTSAAALVLPDHRDGYACARPWSALAAAHATVTERLGLALMDATGLSINDFEVLLRVDGVPPPGLRLGDLQQTVRLSQPALSRMAARLENRALLRRAGDPTDRRGVVLTITPAGQRLLRQAVAVHAKTLQAILLDQLSPDEHDQLADMLDRIVKGSPT